jgi:hypothetical protein
MPAELKAYLLSSNRNAVLGEIACDLVDDIIVSRINHAGNHDRERISGATFLRQFELSAGPDTDLHVAPRDPAVPGFGLQDRYEVFMRFQRCVRHITVLQIAKGAAYLQQIIPQSLSFEVAVCRTDRARRRFIPEPARIPAISRSRR